MQASSIASIRKRNSAIRFRTADSGRVQCREITLAVSNARQGRCDAVVFLLPNRVEFVVVAACAVDRHPQKGLTDGSHQVLNFVAAHDSPHQQRLLRLADGVVSPGDQKAGRCNRVRVVRVQDVAGQL